MEHDGIPEILSVDNLANGALYELLGRELTRCAENICDPNTAANAKRKIKVEISVTPFPDRSGATYAVAVTSTLAGVKPAEGSMYIVRRGAEFLVCPRNTKQQEMQFDMQPAPVATTTQKN